MPVRIIVLGEACNITFELERLGLRGPSSLFEWHVSHNFDDVIKVIKMLCDGKEIFYTTKEDVPGSKFLAGLDISTAHYEKVDYMEIIRRRAERFITDIKSGDQLLFIRYDEYGLRLTIEQVKGFNESILSIEPNCIFKLLLLSPEKGFTSLIEDRLIHRPFIQGMNEHFITDCFEEKIPQVFKDAVDTD
jgi:hypothetical protein